MSAESFAKATKNTHRKNYIKGKYQQVNVVYQLRKDHISGWVCVMNNDELF